MTGNPKNIQQRSLMIDNELQDVFQLRYGRKILQVDSSSSSFNSSQPSFIALLCLIAILTVIFVMTVIFFCYRYYSHRERKLKKRYKQRTRFRQVLSVQNNQQPTEPISVTPTSESLYSVRSSDHLFSNRHERHQTSSVDTLVSRRLQQPVIDAYLNDLHSFQPAQIDVKQLNSYLFIDLHSTSSETFPDTVSRQFTNHTSTSGYNTSVGDETYKKKYRFHLKQQRRRPMSTLKQARTSRFLMRERSLPNNLHRLPQLREAVTQQQKHLFGLDDTNNTSTIIVNDDLQSTNISTTTDDYDDSHAYHVNQNQIMTAIEEEKTSFVQQYLHYEQEPYFFEIVSTSPGDDSDMQIPYAPSPFISNGIAYINDSIIV